MLQWMHHLIRMAIDRVSKWRARYTDDRLGLDFGVSAIEDVCDEADDD